jgi:tetratricopeptide (TPR) repeat protein
LSIDGRGYAPKLTLRPSSLIMSFAMGDVAETVLCPHCGAGNPADSSFCNKCGRPVSSGPDTLTFPGTEEERLKKELTFTPGASFGPRYRIIEEVGRGGMGRVYKAEDLELGTVVALKMIRPEVASSRAMIEHFKAETLTARSVSHENVVRTHDIGAVGPVRYISMDYVRGGSLEDLIRTSGRLSSETTLRLLAQICEALKAAHAKGVIHQDLKPQNVIVDPSGKAYVTDFGLARSAAAPKSAPSGRAYGTPPYFSPEQARGETADERSDIYSLGVMLFEMLTGTLPFRASTIDDYIRKHTSEAPRAPSKAVPGVPSAWDPIVLRCLAKNKEDRYPSVEALQADLRSLLPAGAKRKRVWGPALAATALLAVLAGSLWLVLKPKPAPVSARDGRISVAVLFSVNTLEDSGLANLRLMITDLLITGLNQSKYLRVLPLDHILQVLTKLGQLDAPRHLSGTLDRIAESENVDYFVLPSFVQSGDELQITARIRKARSTETLGTPEAEGPAGNLPALVQGLSVSIRSIFITVPDDTAGGYNLDLDKIATPSPEALGAYVEGERLYALADYAGSVRALERAVASDPEYAMAFWKLAETSYYLGNVGQAKAFIAKALSLSDRVSLRDRYLIEGFAALSLEGDPLKAIESYKKLLALYPNNETGLSYLGSIYRNMEEWDAAIEQYETIRKLDPSYQSVYENLAFIYTAKGWYGKALELLQASGPAFPGVRFFADQTILILIIQGRFGEAGQMVENALAVEPNDRTSLEFKAILKHLRGEPAAARTAYERLREHEEGTGEIRGRIGLAQVSLLGGRYSESRTELRKAVEIARAVNPGFEEMEPLWGLAYLSLRQGRYTEAAAAAAEMEKVGRAAGQSYDLKSALLLTGLAEVGLGNLNAAKADSSELRRIIERSGCPNHMRYVHLLDGRIALAGGYTAAAVVSLERALALLPDQQDRFDEQALFLEALAEAKERAGAPDQAAEAYRNILALTTGRLRWGDIFALAHFRLGRLLQAKNASAEAAGHFEAFLGLWENADPGRPEIEEAKRKLAGLRRETDGPKRPS